jgi:hypothetical protein
VTVKYRPSLHPTRGEITLTKRIPWSIHARAGISDVVADLADLELRSWEVSAGASKIEARLPRPKDAVRIRIGTGASNVVLIRPAGVPVRVHIGGGALKLAIDDFAGSGKIDWRSSTTTSLRSGTTSRSVRERARSRSEPDHPGQSVRGFGLWKLASDS